MAQTYGELVDQARTGNRAAALETAITLMASGESIDSIIGSLSDVVSESELTEFATQLGEAWVAYQVQMGVPAAAITAGAQLDQASGVGLDPASVEGIMASEQYGLNLTRLTTRLHTLAREYRQNASRAQTQAEIASEALAILRVMALRDGYKETELIGTVEGVERYSVDTFTELAIQAAREQFARENGGRQPGRNPMENPVILSIVMVVAILALAALYILAGLPPFGS